MLTSTSTLKGLVVAAALAVSFSATARAGDFTGLDSATGNLYSIDSSTGVATNLGALSGAPPFGLGMMDRANDGSLYAVAPGMFSGYSIYQIDDTTLSASLLHTISTNITGGVGLAVDPSGNSVWVAGFVGFSLNAELQQVNLATGAMTAHGQLAGNFWGLGFDGAGNLYSAVQGTSNPQLVLVDQVNAANSTAVGTEMAGVDMSFGIDFSSDAGSGNLHVISRATDTLYTVNTTTGQATVLSFLTGAAAVFTIAENNVFVADFTGLDSFTGALYEIDSVNGKSKNVGNLAGAPPFGLGMMDRGPNGSLYAVAPGLFSGYSIYKIDQGTLTASLLHTISTNITGGVGLAVDPSGNSVWVAGFVGLSLNADLQQVDLTTGAMTSHGQFGGNYWGLGFDGAGNLYSAVQGISNPQLVLIDQVNAANSTAVGTEMAGVDMQAGIDFSSDVGSGALHVFSRNSDDLYTVNTTTGQATLVANISGASAVFTIAEDNSCQLTKQYGAGCAGTGGFVPELSLTGCPAKGAIVSMDVTKGNGGASCVFLFGLGQASIPVGGGCSLLLSSVQPLMLFVTLGGSGPGAGTVSLAGMIPATVPSVSFTTQVFIADFSTGTGYNTTNGLEIIIP